HSGFRTVTLSRRLVGEAISSAVTPELIEKVKVCLLDFLSCVQESEDFPGPVDYAFRTAVLGHGLVREDMHTGSVSHLGVVIFPTLLALAQARRCSGLNFIKGAVCGYEVGASIGRALMDKETVRLHRPTGITGPLGAAIAGSIMLGLDE